MVSSETAGSAGIYFGWKVVGAAFAVAVFGFGIGFYGPSVFLRTLHGGRGWPISLVSAAITAHFISSALCTAYLPEAYDRWGVTRVTQAGAVCAAVGIVLWAAAPAPWLLFPIALISGAGSAATTGAAINAIVAPWFDKERPKALSMAFNGASVGGLLFTPLWVALIDRLGFAVAAVLVGGVAVAILWPVSIRYLGPPPRPQARHQYPA
jgi:MFS family permease